MKTVIRNSYTPKIGDYCETIVVDKETNSAYIFDCDGVFTPVPQPVDVEKILEEAAAYTDEQVAPLAEKLDTIEEGAQVNVIEHVLKNGTELTITNKTVNVTVPTKTSDLTNDGSDGTDTYVESAALDDYYTKTETDTQIGYETTAREIADSGLQEQIDAIVASSDVVDIVGTYAALQAYDTSKLHDNDIIKVLTDETRDDATTYYRWDADTSTWSYIGAEGPFYTKAESDALFTPMTRTINGNALSSDITLTAADVHALPDSTVIPTVNDATLTIQKNGTAVQTFTANQATNATANITVPTKTSDITNDSGFITEEDVYDEVCESGKTITFQDAAPSSLSSFRLDGETSQNGTPTPSSPVPVQTVTGENVVKICGKNLYDATKSQTAQSGLTYSADTSCLYLNGTVSSDVGIAFMYGELPAGTYKIMLELVSGSLSSTSSGGLFYVGGTGVSTSPSTIILSPSNPKVSATITVSSATDDMRLRTWARRTETYTNAVIKYQIIKGEVDDYNFEPYQGQSYEVNLGKNLFDKDNANILSAYIDSGKQTITSNNNNRIMWIRCEPSTTYTITKLPANYQRGIAYTKELPTSGVQTYGYYSGQNNWENLSFTTGADAKYLVIRIWVVGQDSTSLDNMLASVQIEKGSTATSYASYFTPIELCKIGTYQDYIYKSGEKWYVRKEINKAVLNGSENWAVVGSGTVGYYYKATYDGQVYSTGGKSSHYEWYPYLSTGDTASKQGFAVQNGTTTDFTIRVRYGAEESVANYTNWLSTNNVSVYYIPQTATDTEITNEALIAQLETLLNTARTYAGVNNIFTITQNEQGTLEICYVNTILPYATKDKPGIVQVGNGLSVDSNGVISSDGLTSVDWDDIDDKPTNVSYWTNDAGYITAASLPTVNDATLTIQKNGTDVATFTANSSTNQTANITVPTDTSDLTNGAGFITTAALANYYTKSETYTQNEVNSLINSLSIPTKTSDLVNDSGFLTSIPVASANDLGGVKIGTGLSIDADGVVSVTSAGTVAWADITGKPTDVSYWTNDAGYITLASILTNVSSFTNDAGYITSSDIPTNVSAFTNDAGYLTSSALSNYYTKSETYSQGEVNALINTIAIPTKTSDLTNDGDDGVHAFLATDDVATVATTGDYDDLTNKPTIPTVVDMTGATSSTAGAHGYVPAPAAGDEGKFLQGDGTWATPADEIYTAGNGISIDADNEISADTTVVATKTDLASKQDTLTAGDSIDITNDTISVEVDSALDVSSTNPVQNSVVTAAINGKQDALTAGTGIDITGTTLSVDTSVIAEVSDLPTKTSDLTNDGSDGTSTYVEADDLATVATSGDYEDLTNTPSIPEYQAGNHIDITNGTISAIDYVHSENPVSITTPGTTVSGSEITDGSIGFSKVDSTQFLKLQLTTTDPGEGAALAANTLLGVYQ